MARSRGDRLEAILFVVLALVWGSSYLVIEIAGTALGPFTLVALRLAVAAVALGLVAAFVRAPLPSRRVTAHLVILGALGIALPFTLITWSQRDVDSGLASIIIGATPLLTAVVVALTSRDEPLGAAQVAGLGIGFVGVVVVAGGGIGSGGDPLAVGGLILAAAAYAANGAYARRFLRDVPPVTTSIGQAIAGLVLVAVLAAVIERPVIVLPAPEVVASVLWLGVVASAVAPLIFFRLIATWGATRTAMVNYLAPVIGVSAGIVVLGERPVPALLVGGVLVIAGVALATSRVGSLIGAIPRLGRPVSPVRAA